jgi:hypothetical protein
MAAKCMCRRGERGEGSKPMPQSAKHSNSTRVSFRLAENASEWECGKGENKRGGERWGTRDIFMAKSRGSYGPQQLPGVSNPL